MFPESVTALRWDSRGRLFTSGGDGSLRLWRLTTLGTREGVHERGHRDRPLPVPRLRSISAVTNDSLPSPIEMA